MYTHAKKSQSVEIVIKFLNIAKTRFRQEIYYFRIDEKIFLDHKYDELITKREIIIERLALATQTQNDSIERSKRMII